MPPRKRAEAKPEEPEQTTPPVEEPQRDPAGAADQKPDSDPADGRDTQEPKDGPTPAKSDLQSVEQPCTTCFPHGWPDGAFSVGCEHGTWVRANA